MYNGVGYTTSGYAGVACFRADIGDVDRADQALRSAETTLSQHPRNQDLSWWVSQIERCPARVLRAKGKYVEAETTLRVAISNLDKAIDNNRGSPNLRLPVRLEITRQREEFELADVLVDLGRLPEAEWHARSVLQRMLKRIRGDSPEIPYGLLTMSNILYAEGRYSESRALAKIARNMLVQSGAQSGARDNLVLLNQEARSLIALGQFSSALDRYAEMRANLSSNPELQRFLGRGDADWGLALIKTGKPNEAVEMLRPLLQELQEKLGAEHPETAIVQGELAMALTAIGNKTGALTQFKVATNTLLLPQILNTATPARTARIGLIVEAYIGLLAEMHFTAEKGREGVDAADEAFRLADAIRGRSVQSAMAVAAVRMSAGTPALGEVTRKDQDLERELSALYGAMNTQLSSPPDQQLPDVIARMRARTDAISVERRSLLASIQKDFPNYANLIMPKPATVGDVRNALAPGESLVSVLVTRTGTFVWAIPKTGPAAFAASQLTGADVNALVGSLRRSLDPGQISIDQLVPLDLAAGYRLYSELLLPVEAGWREAKSLLVVTNGALAQLPFALLPTKQEKPASDAQVPFNELKSVSWLVKRVAVTQLPSANSLVTLRAAPAPTIERTPFVGFGDPQFSRAPTAFAETRTARLRNLAVKRVPQVGTDTQFSAGQTFRTEVEAADWVAYEGLAPLPDTRDEIVAIARALKADPERDAHFGADASKQTVMRLDLSRQRVVAFATHGLLPGDLPNLTQPALALSKPADTRESGLLTLTDILSLKLNADWVVLSACNTAAGDGAGAEAISGLGRGFFYAGSRSLLVTHWPVETVSAKKLVTGIFQRVADDPSLSRAEALRQSMLALMDETAVDPATSRATFSYAHPIFWAPYALVGDPVTDHEAGPAPLSQRAGRDSSEHVRPDVAGPAFRVDALFCAGCG